MSEQMVLRVREKNQCARLSSTALNADLPPVRASGNEIEDTHRLRTPNRWVFWNSFP
jgi:hypothetical protein